MRFLPTPFVVLLLATGACEPPTEAGNVFVEVQTDWIPGEELRSVRVTLASQATPDDILASEARDAMGGAAEEAAFRDGLRVAEIGPLAHGPYRVAVELRDPAGTVFATRVVRFQLSQDALALRAVLTRDCGDVSCPGGGAPELTECYGARCVDARCRPGSLEHCPVPACADAADCATAASCASAACVAGACLAFGESSRCEDGDVCDPDEGCRPPRPAITDAGVDSAPRDTTPPDTGAPWDPNADPALILWLPMDETGPIEDLDLNRAPSPLRATCTNRRCPTPTDVGPRGTAFVFDGADDRLVIVHDPTLVTASGFTLTGWMRVSTIPIARTMVILSKPFGGSFRNSWELGFVDLDSDGEGELSFVVDNTVGEATASAEHGLASDTWAHLAAVWEPGSRRLLLHLDGAMVATSAESVTPSFDSSGALVGADDNGAVESFFDGALDDVRIYARALTADEIASVMSAPAP